MSQHQFTTTRNERVEAAVAAVRKGRGVLVVDDEDRENEGDIIFSAASITHEQMALLIRECSGIVCLCLPEDKVRQLDLPQMVANNTCKNRTAFTISIEAAEGVTTGVSAADRVKTIRTAIADDAVPGDLNHPGHVFPLCARSGGVRERAGHTEASVDLMRLAGLPPYGVLCELTNPDGTMARLPEIVGLAMPTALCSNAAANSILVSSHADGHIRTSALIAGGMANSYLAYVSHSIRVMYPVLGAIGLPGALYFAAQFSGGFMVILGVLLWNRWYVSGHGDTPVSGIPPVDEAPLGWPSAVGKAAVRSLTLLFRMVCITVPLMLCIEWLLKNGAFNFWEQYVPDQVNRFFPAELVSVVAAQMGGLVQSSAVAANLRAEGLIDNAQILLAMLVGSAVGNPFRTLRRNLPSALGIFPVPVAFAIVIGMQLSRFVVTLVAIAGVIAFMHYVLY
mgnify:CR=1 FL=1